MPNPPQSDGGGTRRGSSLLYIHIFPHTTEPKSANGATCIARSRGVVYVPWHASYRDLHYLIWHICVLEYWCISTMCAQQSNASSSSAGAVLEPAVLEPAAVLAQLDPASFC